MLNVLTVEETLRLIDERVKPLENTETADLDCATGRVLAEDITGAEYVPGFDRSTVDGYAVRAKDTFGCSESLPALLPQDGEILMGQRAEKSLQPGCCMAVPTGGAVPEGADAVVMIEHTENYGDGTIGILKPAAPGDNMIYRGDDIYPGKILLEAGLALAPQDIGTLAAMGITKVPVRVRPRVGILSTGDELIPAEQEPEDGQIRDVNSHLLSALFRTVGAEVKSYGIIKDVEDAIGSALDAAIEENDMVLISGGSSVGLKDATCRLIEERGELLMHGISMKPGKPTILGIAKGKPVFGLPGHPAAAYFAGRLFAMQAFGRLCGSRQEPVRVTAKISEPIGANHGRTQFTAVTLSGTPDSLLAEPVRSKSGLITGISAADGFISIPRDSEGIGAGQPVEVIRFRNVPY